MRRGAIRRISCREPVQLREQQQQNSQIPYYEMELSPSSTLANDGRDRFIFSTFDNNSNNPISQQMAALAIGQSNCNNGNSNKRLTPAPYSNSAAGVMGSPVLNRSLSTPSVNVIGQPTPSNGAPRIFIANLDYAMKVAEYVPVLRKQLEKHGIEIMDGECYQDKADPTGRNRYAVLTVANDEQVRLAKSKSNEVKVGYRKVWIYDDAELTPTQRDDILRQLRDQLAKQQAIKVVSGPKPLPPYQHPPQPAPVLMHHQQAAIEAIGTPPEEASNRRRFSSANVAGPYMRQSTMLGSSASTANMQSFVSCSQSSVTSTAVTATTTAAINGGGQVGASSATTTAIPTVEITPDDDYDMSAVSTPPSLFQMITPRSSDSSAYSSGASPTPPENNSISSCSNTNKQQQHTPAIAATGFGARAIVGRRRASAVGRLETPDREPDTCNRHRLFPGDAEEDAVTASADISLIKTHGEMFLDYVLSSPTPGNSKQQAINKFRQLINDAKSFSPNAEQGSMNNSLLFYVMSVVNDLRKTGCDRVCFNKQQPQDLPVQLVDWNGFLSVPIHGAPMELYLRMHPCVTIMRLKASHSAAGNSAPLWHMTLALDCEKWAYASNFWLESSWPSDFVTVFQMFVAEVDEPTATGNANGICRSVALERSHFDGIVEDLEELERLGWLHLLGSEYDDGSPRLVGLTLPGYAALWRHAVDRRIHTVQFPVPSQTADIDGRQWLCIADLLRMANDDESEIEKMT